MEDSSRKTYNRSPKYPYLDLRSSLDRLRELFEAERDHPTPYNVVAPHWGYAESSSTGRRVLSALAQFGLLEAEKKGDNHVVRITPLGKKIAIDKRPESPDRDEAIRTAALRPSIYEQIWQRWGADLPSEESLAYHLELDFGFNPNAIDGFVKDYVHTIQFAGLDSSATSDGDDQDKEADIEEPGESTDDADWGKGQARTDLPDTNAQVGNERSSSAAPLDLLIPLDGNTRATLRVPSEMSEKGYRLLKFGVENQLRHLALLLDIDTQREAN